MTRPVRLWARSLAASLLALALTAGVAAAYWTGTGQGSADARLADPTALTLGEGVPAAQLYPGGSADVAVVVTNPNPSPIRVDALALDPSVGAGGFAVDVDHGGCDVASLSFVAQDNGGAGWAVPARAGAADGVRSIALAGALTMSANAGNACQGATFTVHLVVSG